VAALSAVRTRVLKAVLIAGAHRMERARVDVNNIVVIGLC
jgi:hypothetical protein